VDKAHALPAGSALVLAGARPPRLAWLTPWWAHQPFAEARAAQLTPGWELPEPPTVGRPLAMPLPPSPLPARTTAPADLAVKWHKVAGQRPLHPPPPRS
jgi:hypothetical protein